MKQKICTTYYIQVVTIFRCFTNGLASGFALDSFMVIKPCHISSCILFCFSAKWYKELIFGRAQIINKHYQETHACPSSINQGNWQQNIEPRWKAVILISGIPHLCCVCYTAMQHNTYFFNTQSAAVCCNSWYPFWPIDFVP